jgi:RNA polymerase sigma factor (sigma-70 family)
MDDGDWLLQRFAEAEPRLRAVAYRMLGSGSETDDAIQETWLRLSRTDADSVESMPAWLTTVVARVCLNMLRARRTHREEPLDVTVVDQLADPGAAPEDEAVLADSVGLALLVVLDMLTPAERLAFVLHDMFDLPFDEIASILSRTPAATRQLASRARKHVRGTSAPSSPDRTRQKLIVDAYLAASRRGDFDALLALLDPDVVLRADRSAVSQGEPQEIRGAREVVKRALASGARARRAQVALIDGEVGILVAPFGRLLLVLRTTIANGRIAELDVVTDAERLRGLEIRVLE